MGGSGLNRKFVKVGLPKKAYLWVRQISTYQEIGNYGNKHEDT